MNTPHDQPFLSARGLSCQRGARMLFAGLSFDLPRGGLITLSGPNGSGKSTLLRILAGLSAPEAGHVRISGADPTEAASLVHYHGHREGLREALTVRENLAFASTILRAPQPPYAAISLDDALIRVGARRLADLPVRVLSAGQRRRVALARLLTAPRGLWLLDEPLASLDTAGQTLVCDLIAQHIAGEGAAIVATHQPLSVTGEPLRLGDLS